MKITDSKIAAFQSSPEPCLIGCIRRIFHRNRAAKNFSIGFYGADICISSELFEEIGAKFAAFGWTSICFANKIGQSNKDLTGALQYLLFFTRTGFNQLQDVFLNLSYRYSFLLSSGESDRYPRWNHGDKHKQHQAETQGFKEEKFH
ncbi:MAG: hypothetical protein PVG35_00745 [Desulfobacterales bacterium]